MQRIVHRSASFVAWLLVVVSAQQALAVDPRQRDLYLASRDDIQKVTARLGELPASQGGTFVGIVGGLAALNFIERLQPSEILLVDLNPAQVEYGRCVVELVKQSPSREAFVSAFFSRPFKADKAGEPDKAAEAAFLAQPGDPKLLQSTTQKIQDATLRESCARDLALIAEATYDRASGSLLVARNTNGRFLQLRGPDHGMPAGYNFLYFGRGWLASDASYAHTRTALGAAHIRFLVSDIGAVPVEDIHGENIVFWGSNLSTWFREGKDAYERFVIRAHEAFFARNEAIRFVVLSTYRRTVTTNFVPFKLLAAGDHLDASAKVRKYAEGKRVLELIPGTGRFGTELRAKDIVTQPAAQPVDPSAPFDVVVLHLLNNAGIHWWHADRTREFAALYASALGRAAEVVILEHNRASQDFSDKERARMIGLGDLLQPLFAELAKHRLTLDLEHAVGEADSIRNLVLHIKKL